MWSFRAWEGCRAGTGPTFRVCKTSKCARAVSLLRGMGFLTVAWLQGTKYHSAAYPVGPEAEEGKRVAVIGSVRFGRGDHIATGILRSMRSAGLVSDPDRPRSCETRETARQLRARIHLDRNAFRLGGARQAKA